jgi:hypothetical protein
MIVEKKMNIRFGPNNEDDDFSSDVLDSGGKVTIGELQLFRCSVQHA